MKPKESSPQSADMFRHRFDEVINMARPLVKLLQLLDWSVFEQKLAGYFPSDKGRPGCERRLRLLCAVPGRIVTAESNYLKGGYKIDKDK